MARRKQGKTVRTLGKVARAYFSNKKGGLSNAETLRRNNPDLSPSAIRDFFDTDPAVVQYVPRRRESNRNHVHKMRIRYSFEFVHADTGHFGMNNKSVWKYYVLVVEPFTRALFAAAVKKKSDITKALQTLFEKSIFPKAPYYSVHPIKIFIDAGTELLNQPFKDWCKQNRVHIFVMKSSPSKAFLAERYQRVILGKIRKLQAHEGGTHDMKRFLAMAVESHNNTATRRLEGYSPKDLLQRVPGAVAMRRKQVHDMTLTRKNSDAFKAKVRRLNKIPLHSWVRIATLKRPFEKEASFKANSLALFKIVKLRYPRRQDGTTSPYFFLQDLEGNNIQGAFRKNELIPLLKHHWPDQPGYKFTISEWVRKRYDKRKYLIRLAEFPPDYFREIEKKDFKHYRYLPSVKSRP